MPGFLALPVTGQLAVRAMPLFASVFFAVVTLTILVVFVWGVIKRSRSLIITGCLAGIVFFGLLAWAGRDKHVGSFSFQDTTFDFYAATSIDGVDVTLKIRGPGGVRRDGNVLFFPSAGLPPTTFEAAFSRSQNTLWILARVTGFDSDYRNPVARFRYRDSSLWCYSTDGFSPDLDSVAEDAEVIKKINFELSALTKRGTE